MKNINWKVRLQSGAFWIGVTGLVLTLLYYIFDLVGFIPAYSQEQIVNVVMMVVQILSFIGIVTDP
ncbi:phage holin, partial [Christensenella hongkongensis]